MINLRDIKKVFGKGNARITVMADRDDPPAYAGLVRDMPTEFDYYYVSKGDIVNNIIEVEVM